MQPHRRVILLIEATSAYGRGCLRGIARYARARGGWIFFHRLRYPFELLKFNELRNWNADGIIARIDNPSVARIVRRLALPAVDLSGSSVIEGVAGVFPDHRKIITLAAEHLVSNGLRNLAFCGYPGVYFSDFRQGVFDSEVQAQHGVKCVFEPPPITDAISYEQRGVLDAEALQAWVGQLPKPIGVIACSDTRGRQVLEACDAVGIKVPHEVSVIGVDDDDVVCELSNPRLSSVVPNVETTGYEAARLLDRLFGGEPCPDEPLLIPPIAIEGRTSSDMTALSDPALAAAVQFIRNRVGEGINVEDVLAKVEISRSTLERQFYEHLGCTPHEFILRCRIERAKQLLLDTDYPLARIARMAGFRRVGHMITVFRERSGQTPAKYRRATN